ncbi:MAG: hypothetical protein IJZ47_09655 [Oscillospiraceae bacterium]|nr:hypothetical protein [Oscillospiraceae bacterium]
MINFVLICYIIICAVLQHITHELSHVLAAVMCREKITRIQWLTYNGGTKVFFRNEPDFDTAPVAKKWAFISAAGFIGTNILAYIFTVVFILVPAGYIKLFFMIAAGIFLVTDSAHFLLAAVFDFGDVYGLKRTLKCSKGILVIAATLNVLINTILFLYIF